MTAAAASNDARLDLRAKLYQSSIWPSVTSVSRGKRLAAPLVVDLDPTTFCDLACPECISGRLLNQGRFTTERLEQLAREFVAAGVRAVILIGGGEPLAHRGTRAVIETLGNAGVGVGVVTNGTLIDRHLDALAAFASWVRVSVDAGCSATYGRFRPHRRGHSMFDRVIDNMRALADRTSGALGYSFLLMSRLRASGEVAETNYNEVLAAARLARSIGCDYFELKALFDSDHYVIEQPPELLESLERQVEELRELDGVDFRVLLSSTLHALRGGQPAVQQKAYTTCRVAELRTLVTPKGMFICPYHRGNPQAKLGDVVDRGFDETWQAAKMHAIDPSRDCGFHCARHESNLDLERIGAGAGHDLVVDDFDLFI